MSVIPIVSAGSLPESFFAPRTFSAGTAETVAGILDHEEYIGNTISCRTYTPSFKSKKSLLNPPDKILRFEGTHEPLIDLDTWEIVQRVRQGKRRPTKMGQQDMLSGLV